MRKLPPRSYLRTRPRGTPRRLALGLALLAALVFSAWRVGALEVADGVAATSRSGASDPATAASNVTAAADGASADGAADEEPAAHPRGSRLTAAGPKNPETFLGTPGIALEPVSEREGPQARMRVRGLRIVRGAPRLRLELNPEAPRILSRKLTHLDSLPALLRARSGIVPSRGTSRPPPSHSS